MPRGRRPAHAATTFARLVALETDDCVLWPHSTNAYGYGRIRIDNQAFYVHRLALERHEGQAPSKRPEAAHSCHTPGCMNYRHLRWASRRENEQDKLLDGTHNRGEQHEMVKLTEDQVREIRRRWADRSATQKAMAEEFGVHRHTIHLIIHRKRWGWLT